MALGDDADPALLNAWFKGASVVVDCATPYPVWMFEKPRRKTTNSAVERTRNIIKAVKASNANFVLISSFTTRPGPNSITGAVLKGALHGSHIYFEVKKQVEREVQKHILAGLPGAIIAPSTCFGPYDLKAREQTFIPMLLSNKVPILARHELNVVDVRDVAEVAYAAALCGRFTQPIPVYGHNISLPALAEQICALRGKPAPKIAVPTVFGAANLYWMETMYALTGQKTPWPSLSMLLLAASSPAVPSAVQLRLHPSVRPLDQTLTHAVEWYEKIGRL